MRKHRRPLPKRGCLHYVMALEASLPEHARRVTERPGGGRTMGHTRFLAVALSTAAALAACSHQPDQPSNVAIQGIVLDEFGHPWPSQPVVISAGTFSQRVLSDSSGSFTVKNVPTPYNAMVIDATSTAFATLYVGLTRTDPTLTIGNYQFPKRSGGLGGQLIGGSYPESSEYSTGLVFASPEVTPV